MVYGLRIFEGRFCDCNSYDDVLSGSTPEEDSDESKISGIKVLMYLPSVWILLNELVSFFVGAHLMEITKRVEKIACERG